MSEDTLEINNFKPVPKLKILDTFVNYDDFVQKVQEYANFNNFQLRKEK